MKHKLNSAKILIFVIALVLASSVVNARPVTDAFVDGVVRINDFFTGREYEPYSTAIDFFLFAILFTAVYMAGAKHAFKEVKNPEKVIVILLGLTTAFLMVLAGFSVTLLLPFANWILYILLFLLFFWILGKNDSKLGKSTFWRFLLALLLVLLLLAFLQGFYSLNLLFRLCELWYFNWLILILSFLFWIFVFRKAIKNRFWRLIVALLLTLLIFFTMQKVCGSVDLPEVSGISSTAGAAPSKTTGAVAGFFGGVGNYFKSMWDNFKAYDYGGYFSAWPDWLRSKVSRPVSTEIPGRLPVVTTPREGTGKVAVSPDSTTGRQLAPTPDVSPDSTTGRQLAPTPDEAKPVQPAPKPAPTPSPTPTPTPTTTPKPTPSPAPGATVTTPPPGMPFIIIPPKTLNVIDLKVGDILSSNGRRVEHFSNTGSDVTIVYSDKNVQNYRGIFTVGEAEIVRGAKVEEEIKVGNDKYMFKKGVDGKYSLVKRNFLWDKLDKNIPITDQDFRNNYNQEADKHGIKPISENLNSKGLEIYHAGVLDSILNPIIDLFKSLGWWVLLIFVILYIAWRKKRKHTKKLEELGPIYKQKRLIEELGKLIEESNNATAEMARRANNRNYLLKSVDLHTQYVQAMTKGGTDRANIFYPAGRKVLLQEHKEIAHILQEEFAFLDALNKLKETELKLLAALREIKKKH